MWQAVYLLHLDRWQIRNAATGETLPLTLPGRWGERANGLADKLNESRRAGTEPRDMIQIATDEQG
ncbi:MAG: hypothetical protein AB7E98_11985 [Pirellulales bacterium]